MENRSSPLRADAYKPSPSKLKKAEMFPNTLPFSDKLNIVRITSKKKQNLKLSNGSSLSASVSQQLFKSQAIDKQSVFEELQRVKRQIMDFKDRNEELIRANQALEDELRECTQNNQNMGVHFSSTGEKNFLYQSLVKQVDELKRRKEQKLHELQALKKTPKYTTFLELEIEKNLCLEQLGTLKNGIRSELRSQHAHRKDISNMKKKVEEREKLLTRMKDSLTRENHQLQNMLAELIQNNQMGEHKLKELERKNTQYKAEVDRLKISMRKSQEGQSPALRINIPLNDQKLKAVAMEIVLKTVKFNRQLESLNDEVTKVVTNSRTTSSEVDLVGTRHMEILRMHLRTQGDLGQFLNHLQQLYSKLFSAKENKQTSVQNAYLSVKLQDIAHQQSSICLQDLEQLCKNTYGSQFQQQLFSILFETCDFAEDGFTQNIFINRIIELVEKKEECPLPTVVVTSALSISGHISSPSTNKASEVKHKPGSVEDYEEDFEQDKQQQQIQDEQEGYGDDFEVDTQKKKTSSSLNNHASKKSHNIVGEQEEYAMGFDDESQPGTKYSIKCCGQTQLVKQVSKATPEQVEYQLEGHQEDIEKESQKLVQEIEDESKKYEGDNIKSPEVRESVENMIQESIKKRSQKFLESHKSMSSQRIKGQGTDSGVQSQQSPRPTREELLALVRALLQGMETKVIEKLIQSRKNIETSSDTNKNIVQIYELAKNTLERLYEQTLIKVSSKREDKSSSKSQTQRSSRDIIETSVAEFLEGLFKKLARNASW